MGVSQLLAKKRVAFCRIRFQDCFRSETGSVAVEYALMLALFSAILVTSVQTLGKLSSNVLGKIASELRDAQDRPPQATQAR